MCISVKIIINYISLYSALYSIQKEGCAKFVYAMNALVIVTHCVLVEAILDLASLHKK